MRAFAFLVSFVIAFLLFVVQPMATKLVLPVLGGTPAVWNTAMLTFQILLLLGYAYAHVLAHYVAPRWQVLVHGLVALAACSVLPLNITLATSDGMIANPIPYLVMAFVLHVGLPFFCLSATAPLLQSWVSRSSHPLAASPYVLYSASNLGSFAALIGYIVLIEPNFTLGEQRHLWSGLFVAGAVALLGLGWSLKPSQPLASTADGGSAIPALHWKRCLFWVWLAFLPSSLSLGVTTYITTDIASMPLLWVLPFALYLLSFVDAFSVRPLFVGAALRLAPIMTLLGLMVYVLSVRVTWVFPLHVLVFAVLAFALHGALAKAKPHQQHLTWFYFCLSIGGALGGVMNGLLAPMLFERTIEYPLALLLAAATSVVLLQPARWVPSARLKTLQHFAKFAMLSLGYTAVLYIVFCIGSGGWDAVAGPWNPKIVRLAFCGSVITAVLLHRRDMLVMYGAFYAALLLMALAQQPYGDFKEMAVHRNFFGMQRVMEDSAKGVRIVVHGTTNHGVQTSDEATRLQPVSYYAHLQEVFAAANHAHPLPPVGLIGMGIGTVQCYVQPGQRVDFFEINPHMVEVAMDARYFTYLRDCPGTRRILLGDGRIRLAEQPDGYYGLVLLDAFSSDAIPVHLLTVEALQGYIHKLMPEGILAIHTTNRHINLWPLLGLQAKALGLEAYGKAFPSNDVPFVMDTTWVVLARSPEAMARLTANSDGWQRLDAPNGRPWTDDYTNLLPYMEMFH